MDWRRRPDVLEADIEVLVGNFKRPRHDSCSAGKTGNLVSKTHGRGEPQMLSTCPDSAWSATTLRCQGSGRQMACCGTQEPQSDTCWAVQVKQGLFATRVPTTVPSQEDQRKHMTPLAVRPTSALSPLSSDHSPKTNSITNRTWYPLPQNPLKKDVFSLASTPSKLGCLALSLRKFLHWLPPF